jgi:hypothetical protein
MHGLDDRMDGMVRMVFKTVQCSLVLRVFKTVCMVLLTVQSTYALGVIYHSFAWSL